VGKNQPCASQKIWIFFATLSFATQHITVAIFVLPTDLSAEASSSISVKTVATFPQAIVQIVIVAHGRDVCGSNKRRPCSEVLVFGREAGLNRGGEKPSVYLAPKIKRSFPL
jgi:hypothetical protein